MEEYSNKSRNVLINFCKEKGIKGYGKKTKSDIIKLIQKAENEIVAVKNETTYQIDKVERIRRLVEHLTILEVNHEDQIMRLNSLKEAHVYCVIHGVSAQRYGPLLEKFIRLKYDYIKNNSKDCNGDCSKDGKNSEVKVSLGGAKHTKFNYVQLRPTHDCETYIFTAYHLSSNNVLDEGELYVFKIPKMELKELIISYGGYAHGTKKEHGKISLDSIDDEKNIREYAIRPTIGDKCWNALLSFRSQESDL